MVKQQQPEPKPATPRRYDLIAKRFKELIGVGQTKSIITRIASEQACSPQYVSRALKTVGISARREIAAVEKQMYAGVIKDAFHGGELTGGLATRLGMSKYKVGRLVDRLATEDEDVVRAYANVSLRGQTSATKTADRIAGMLATPLGRRGSHLTWNFGETSNAVRLELEREQLRAAHARLLATAIVDGRDAPSLAAALRLPLKSVYRLVSLETLLHDHELVRLADVLQASQAWYERGEVQARWQETSLVPASNRLNAILVTFRQVMEGQALAVGEDRAEWDVQRPVALEALRSRGPEHAPALARITRELHRLLRRQRERLLERARLMAQLDAHRQDLLQAAQGAFLQLAGERVKDPSKPLQRYREAVKRGVRDFSPAMARLRSEMLSQIP